MKTSRSRINVKLGLTRFLNKKPFFMEIMYYGNMYFITTEKGTSKAHVDVELKLHNNREEVWAK